MFATSTVTTILNSVLADAGSILSVNLPIIMIFLVAIAATFFMFRWVMSIFGRGGRRRR